MFTDPQFHQGQLLGYADRYASEMSYYRISEVLELHGEWLLVLADPHSGVRKHLISEQDYQQFQVRCRDNVSIKFV